MSADPTIARAIVRPGIDCDAIDDCAAKWAWQLVNVLPGDAERPAQLIFSAAGAQVHVVEDARLGVVYLQAEGPAATGVVEQVREVIACFDPTDAPALCASPELGDRRVGLALLALQGSGTAEEVDLMGRALAADDHIVRACALAAAAYVPWHALAAHLEAMRASDPDPSLRNGAASWLQAMVPR